MSNLTYPLFRFNKALFLFFKTNQIKNYNGEFDINPYQASVRAISLRVCEKQPAEIFCEKSVLRNSKKFTEKHLCQSLFFNKVAGLRPVNFAKFLRTPFIREHFCWLLLLFLQNTSGGCFWFVRSTMTSERCFAKRNSDFL